LERSGFFSTQGYTKIPFGSTYLKKTYIMPAEAQFLMYVMKKRRSKL
jgi:hypothetical protein